MAEEGEASEQEEESDDSSATRPIARPTATDWFAGAVTVILQLGILLLAIGAIAAAIRWLRRLL